MRKRNPVEFALAPAQGLLACSSIGSRRLRVFVRVNFSFGGRERVDRSFFVGDEDG